MRRFAFAAAAAVLVMHAAHAADPYPARTIRFIVPFPPGGATDVVTRVVAQKLKQGAESYATSPEEFTQVVQRDVAKWANVVKASGAKLE